MFVSWLDTETTIAIDNTAPDIWARGVDVVEHLMTVDKNGNDKPVNVTFGCEVIFSACFFAQSNEVIVGEDGLFTIPYIYENMTPNDPGQPVQFKYIRDFSFAEEDFVITRTDENRALALSGMELSQLFPNPARSNMHFNLELLKPALVDFKISNLLGQVVCKNPGGQMDAGSNPVIMNISGFTSGLYFLSAQAESQTITRKLIIE